MDATVAAYFQMLAFEARGEPYSKADFNRELRGKLRTPTKGAIELKHQNISAILQDVHLPFIDGYIHSEPERARGSRYRAR